MLNEVFDSTFNIPRRRIHQIFDVSLRPLHWTLDDSPHIESDLACEFGHGLNRGVAFCIVADDPTLPHVAAPNLELRLDQRDEASPQKFCDGRQDELERNE